MTEYLTKQEFINFLAREAAAHAELTASMDRPPRGLSLEFVPPDKGSTELSLVVRGNQVPQQWIMFKGGFKAGREGYPSANQGAFEIAFAAAAIASRVAGKKIVIGLPELEFDAAWGG